MQAAASDEEETDAEVIVAGPGRADDARMVVSTVSISVDLGLWIQRRADEVVSEWRAGSDPPNRYPGPLMSEDPELYIFPADENLVGKPSPALKAPFEATLDRDSDGSLVQVFRDQTGAPKRQPAWNANMVARSQSAADADARSPGSVEAFEGAVVVGCSVLVGCSCEEIARLIADCRRRVTQTLGPVPNFLRHWRPRTHLSDRRVDPRTAALHRAHMDVFGHVISAQCQMLCERLMADERVLAQAMRRLDAHRHGGQADS